MADDYRDPIVPDDIPAPVAHARTAAQAVREINRLTAGDTCGLDTPADLYGVVAALAELAERLPQALNRLARIANGWRAHPGLYDDRGPEHHPDAVLAATSRYLELAAAVKLDANLRAAAHRLYHLGVRDE